MSDWVLVVTHALAATGGAAGMRWWITRKVRVRNLENGHKALELRHAGDTDQ